MYLLCPLYLFDLSTSLTNKMWILVFFIALVTSQYITKDDTSRFIPKRSNGKFGFLSEESHADLCKSPNMIILCPEDEPKCYHTNTIEFVDNFMASTKKTYFFVTNADLLSSGAVPVLDGKFVIPQTEYVAYQVMLKQFREHVMNSTLSASSKVVLLHLLYS